MKIKTAELTGAALDWAVSLIENPDWTDEDRWLNTLDYIDSGDPEDEPYEPSLNWSQGGPIIDREKIDLKYCGYDNPPFWGAVKLSPSRYDRRGTVGPTALVAAMRCYVASKLGNEVEVPDELLES